MCGRFVLDADKRELMERFLLEALPEEVPPRYNIAPTQPVLTVMRDEGTMKADWFRWGLVPAWSDSPHPRFRMINARAETLAEKPSWRRLLKRRRCLIPATGYYEWKAVSGKKQPYLIRLPGGKLFSFAGLWDEWERDGQVIRSCTIITTEANERARDVHDRMPVILTPQTETMWLDMQDTDPGVYRELLMSVPDPDLEMYPVSTRVNSPKAEGEHLIHPVE
ncbi:SOS response-associated peptidase [Staphylospora marina]|uniref:SOS response-associated peptidase n=1 Tax=Staphylospora marina TaxID=2490858 RepID=UPI000F5BA72B|nr:SOS response-associated peptidase [Staphylospora marina]